MKWESAKAFLEKLGVRTNNAVISGAFRNVTCPFATWFHASGKDNHPSFGVTCDEDGERRSFYKCLSCGESGSLALLPAKLGRLRGEDLSHLVKEGERIENDETVEVSSVIPDWETLTVNRFSEARKYTRKIYGSAIGHPYLKKRGYHWSAAHKLRLQYDEYQQRILFPVYDHERLVHHNRLAKAGYTGRSVLPARYLNRRNPKSRDYGGLQKQHLFIFHPVFYTRVSATPLILVEGPFDYARGVMAGFWGTHSNMGTAMTDSKRDWLISLNRPVYLFFDNDTAGDAAMFGNRNNETGERENLHRAWAPVLSRHVPVWICRYPETAIVDERGDPDSLTESEFRWGVDNAYLYGGSDEIPDFDNPYNVPF